MLTLIVLGTGLVLAIALLVGRMIRHGTADDRVLRRMRRAGY